MPIISYSLNKTSAKTILYLLHSCLQFVTHARCSPLPLIISDSLLCCQFYYSILWLLHALRSSLSLHVCVCVCLYFCNYASTVTTKTQNRMKIKIKHEKSEEKNIDMARLALCLTGFSSCASPCYLPLLLLFIQCLAALRFISIRFDCVELGGRKREKSVESGEQ